MSDGIKLCSPCCNGEMCLKKEYDEYKVKKIDHLKDSEELYDSNIPVYTCLKCGKKWAIERVCIFKNSNLN